MPIHNFFVGGMIDWYVKKRKIRRKKIYKVVVSEHTFFFHKTRAIKKTVILHITKQDFFKAMSNRCCWLLKD